MKTITIFIFLAATTLFLTSCHSTYYYQVYKTSPEDNLITNANNLVYEDANCKVSYNLWDEAGDAGFRFYNKTDDGIYLNLEESFFILNGRAYDYYQNRVYTKSSTAGTSIANTATASKSVLGFNYLNLLQTNSLQATTSVGSVSSSGYSTAYTEEKMIYIPSKTSKVINEFHINSALFRDCALFKYPSKSEVKTKSFSKEDSPIVFSNRIAYTVGQKGELTKFENTFYVTEITNYPESLMLESQRDEFCGQKISSKTKYFKTNSPEKFYIRYPKGSDLWKH